MVTSKHRLLGVVLGLGGCALAIDKLVIGGSDPASVQAEDLLVAPSERPGIAGAATPPAGGGEEGPSAKPLRSAPPVGLLGLDERLRALGDRLTQDPNGPVDPFTPPASWLAAPSETPEARQAQAPAQPPPPLPKLRLSATLLPEPGSRAPAIAVIDGRRRVVGDLVSGMAISSIREDGVTLTRGEQTLTIVIPRPAMGDEPAGYGEAR